MTLTDLTGFTGVALLLIAYFLNLRDIIKKDSSAYLLLNLIGAGIACSASVLLKYLPFIILEGCWTLVSAVSLINHLVKLRKMSGETNLDKLLKTLKPKQNPGEFVFCVIDEPDKENLKDAVLFFKEDEGYTIILTKQLADSLKLNYPFVASWITLAVHSSLHAVGLTAAFSKALAESEISCNVVAAYYHDHIFVDIKDTEKAMEILTALSK